jgi:hypothetical protein
MTKVTVSTAGGAMPEAARIAANPMFNNDRLITATGKIDHQFIALSARARCESRYGAECRPEDIAYYAEMLTGMAGMLAAKFKADLPTVEPAKAVTVQIPARSLIAGDVVGSGETIITVQRGVRTPAGKVEVVLDRAGIRRRSLWGASTLINARRSA